MPLTRIDLRRATPRRAPAPPRLRRRAGLLAALAGAAVLGACGGRDPFAPDPSNNADTQQSDLLVYPFTGASGPLGSAVALLSLSVVRPLLTSVVVSTSPPQSVITANFDLAVDRAPGGRVRLLPSRVVVDLNGVGSVFSTGVQTSRTPFDSIAEAPTEGYQADTVATTVGVNEPVIVRFQTSGCTAYYAKAVVVGVDAASGVVTLRARVNPNCGFRSLRVGRG